MDLLDKVEYEPKGYFIDPEGNTHSLAGIMDMTPLQEDDDSYFFTIRWWNGAEAKIIYGTSEGEPEAEAQALKDMENLRKEMGYQVLRGFFGPLCD